MLRRGRAPRPASDRKRQAPRAGIGSSCTSQRPTRRTATPRAVSAVFFFSCHCSIYYSPTALASFIDPLHFHQLPIDGSSECECDGSPSMCPCPVLSSSATSPRARLDRRCLHVPGSILSSQNRLFLPLETTAPSIPFQIVNFVNNRQGYSTCCPS